MDDHPHNSKNTPSAGGNQRVDALANRVLSVVAESVRKSSPDALPAHAVMSDAVFDAALSVEADAVWTALAKYSAMGVPLDTLCETVIVDVARRLGDQWCEDELGFAGVTIGCARLTAALRRLEALTPLPLDPRTPQVLILVGNEIYHTLGATVLAGMMRRSGVETQLWIGADVAAVASHLETSEFSAVFISASKGEKIESLRRLVATAHAANPDLPVVVGGTIIDTPNTPDQIKELTGANHVTKDPNEALKLCEIHHQPAPPAIPPAPIRTKGG